MNAGTAKIESQHLHSKYLKSSILGEVAAMPIWEIIYFITYRIVLFIFSFVTATY
jgi:hypothetical protein